MVVSKIHSNRNRNSPLVIGNTLKFAIVGRRSKRWALGRPPLRSGSQRQLMLAGVKKVYVRFYCMIDKNCNVQESRDWMRCRAD